MYIWKTLQTRCRDKVRSLYACEQPRIESSRCVHYAGPVCWPEISYYPRFDGVGEIAAIGEGVEGWHVGDAVVINPSLDWGDDPAVPGTAVAHPGPAR